MKTLVVILYIAFANAPLPGQALGQNEANPSGRIPGTDRVERFSKAFPPEFAAPSETLTTVAPRRSYCVYPSPGTGSLAIKPCPAIPSHPRLIPALKNTAPKPAAGPRAGKV